jgi:integrase
MKHPGEKIGNDTWVDLPDEAIEVIESMPKTKPEIFPYSPDAITANFTRACKLLGIEDLRFHDLRHEGISRLFEMGWNIPKVPRSVDTGHGSASSATPTFAKRVTDFLNGMACKTLSTTHEGAKDTMKAAAARNYRGRHTLQIAA